MDKWTSLWAVYLLILFNMKHQYEFGASSANNRFLEVGTDKYCVTLTRSNILLSLALTNILRVKSWMLWKLFVKQYVLLSSLHTFPSNPCFCLSAFQLANKNKLSFICNQFLQKTLHHTVLLNKSVLKHSFSEGVYMLLLLFNVTS